MPGGGEFVAHVLELLAPCGRASARRMFGGHGVYLDGLFVAIIADDELYLKADARSQQHFEQAGSSPFVYVKNGRPMTMGYWRAPGEALDAPQLMRPWAKLALEAALRARAADARKKTGRKTRPA
jgi:DNA transformation protein